MLNFASNISDGEDVQFVNASIPSTSKSPILHRPTSSPIRRPPIPSSSVAGPPQQIQHPRLMIPNIEKPTKKKGPVPKLYDGECCKSKKSKREFYSPYKSAEIKQVDSTTTSSPVKAARDSTEERFWKRGRSGAKELKSASV